MHLETSLARNGFFVCVGQIARLAEGEDGALARAVLEQPDYANLRRLLNASHGKPWRLPLLEALAEIGMLYAQEMVYG
jgi:hypothetical protein